MSCPKCKTGLLIQEQVFDRYESHCSLTMTKCCNCGLYDDAQMRINRKVTGSMFPVFRVKSRTLTQ